MSFYYKINGFQLGQQTARTGIWLLDSTEYAPALAPRRISVDIPGRHYQVPMWGDPMSAVTVTMKVRIRETTTPALRSSWELLTGLLGIGSNNPIELRRWRDGYEELAEAQLISTDSPSYLDVIDTLDVTLVFNIPGGCWKSVAFVEDTFAGAGTYTTSTLANGSTMPVIDVRILATGPLTTILVRDGVSRTGIAWGGGTQVVPSGQFLLIDPDSMRAYIQTTASYNLTGTAAHSTLVFVDRAPLVVTSTRSGASATVSSSIVIERTGGAGQVKLRAQTARI